MKRLWVRLGDACEYEDFGLDFDAAAGCVREFGIVRVGGWTPGGFVPHGFEEHNYVSLYWGDAAANMVRT